MQFLAIAMVVFIVFVAAGCSVAIVLGDQEVRRATWGYLAAVVATQIASLFGPHWHGPEYGVMLVDAAYAAVLAHIAGRSSRWWPIWAASGQLAGTLSHLMSIVIPDLPKAMYLKIQPVWGFVVLGVIAGGALASRMRRY